VFNNKTVLGAITLDMVAVLWSGSVVTHFAQDILKVGPEGFGFLRAVRQLVLITMLITAYSLEQKMQG
jgi:hypothetical protein